MMRALAAALCLAPAAFFGVFSILVPEPPFLVNWTPSVSPGLYRRIGDLPRIGDYVAIRPIGDGFAALARIGLALPDRPILKPVLAGPGALVCFRNGAFHMGEHTVIPVVRRTSNGARLPIWRECRRLHEGEYFVHSDRIPNSLDSRYFGPVTADMIIGAYTLLWAW